jgi:flagellar hook-associated protein 2
MSSISSTSSLLNLTGLVSDIDWQGLVDDIIETQSTAAKKPLETVMTKQQNILSAWQSFNTTLSKVTNYIDTYNLDEDKGYENYSGALTSSDTSVTPSDILSVSVGTGDIQKGTYSIVVSTLAQAEKITSDEFSSTTTALGYSGDILINGNVVTIEATDTWNSIASKINGADAGVTASILSISEGHYKMTLESDSEGAAGMSVRNGGASNILESLTLTGTEQLAHDTGTDAESDTFSSKTDAIGTLLGLTSPQIGSITIKGISVDIDLSTDTLESIAQAVNDATISGVTASVEESTVDGSTVYSLKLTGVEASDLTDANNMLETLGVLEGSWKNTPIRTGEDAAFSIDGNNIVSSSNTVTGVISGVTLDLVGTSASTITLTIERNNDDLSTTVTSLVDYLSSALTYIKDQNTYDSESTSTTANILMGNSTLLGIKHTITSILQTTISGNSQYTTAASIGISLESDGSLDFDTDTFAAALSDNPTEVLNAVQSLSDSLATALSVYVDPITGTLETIQSTTQTRIDTLEDKISDVEARYERKAEVLQKKYAALMTLLQQSSLTQNWLTQMVDSMTNSGDK